MELDGMDTTSQHCLLKGTLRYFSALSPERDVALDSDG